MRQKYAGLISNGLRLTDIRLSPSRRLLAWLTCPTGNGFSLHQSQLFLPPSQILSGLQSLLGIPFDDRRVPYQAHNSMRGMVWFCMEVLMRTGNCQVFGIATPERQTDLHVLPSQLIQQGCG